MTKPSAPTLPNEAPPEEAHEGPSATEWPFALLNEAPAWLERHVLQPTLDFLQRVFSMPSAAHSAKLRRAAQAAAPAKKAELARLEAPGCLPFDLYLATGTHSIKLFPCGPIDPLCFFQRFDVPSRHDVEYVTRLEPEDQGSEAFRGYGMFTFLARRAQEVSRLATLHRFWAVLQRKYGLSRVPRAKTLIAKRFTGFHPEHGSTLAGRKQVAAPRYARVFTTARGRGYTYQDMVKILDEELLGVEKISWIEEAFLDCPAQGEVVHRYYLDRSGEAWVVRHHWSEGKRLFEARLSREITQRFPKAA